MPGQEWYPSESGTRIVMVPEGDKCQRFSSAKGNLALARHWYYGLSGTRAGNPAHTRYRSKVCVGEMAPGSKGHRSRDAIIVITAIIRVIAMIVVIQHPRRFYISLVFPK